MNCKTDNSPFPSVCPAYRQAMSKAEVQSFSCLKDLVLYVMPEDNGKYVVTDS